MKEKINNNNISDPQAEPKRKWWKVYLFPHETPKQLAKNGLIIMLVGGIAMSFFEGSLVGDLFNIMAFYGQLLLLMALIKWIKNKIQKKRASNYERKN